MFRMRSSMLSLQKLVLPRSGRPEGALVLLLSEGKHVPFRGDRYAGDYFRRAARMACTNSSGTSAGAG